MRTFYHAAQIPQGGSHPNNDGTAEIAAKKHKSHKIKKFKMGKPGMSIPMAVRTKPSWL